VVLLEQDDLMHQNTGESKYDETAYVNFFDHPPGPANPNDATL
jgi:hypothetical protein